MTGAELSWTAERDGLCALPIRPLRPLRWTAHDDRVTVHLDHRDVDFKPRVLPLLEALRGESSLPDLVDALLEADPERGRASAERSARFLVTGLAYNGLVEVVLPSAPRVLADRYAIEGELGRGGVGVVWAARDLHDGERRLVVKHAWNWTGPLAKREETIRQEAAVMGRLDHPGVVRAVDLVVHGGRAHLVRSYVDGRELGRVVHEGGAADIETRRRWTRQAAEALAHLHQRGVLCLDVKPANFMRQRHGGLVLADMSHCRVVEGARLELPGALGTRNYMAPEVAKEHVATPRSDVYGLGRFHAALVLGHDPPTGATGEALLDRLAAAGATEGELALVAECCAEDPEARPAGAGAVAKRLSA